MNEVMNVETSMGIGLLMGLFLFIVFIAMFFSVKKVREEDEEEEVQEEWNEKDEILLKAIKKSMVIHNSAGLGKLVYKRIIDTNVLMSDVAKKAGFSAAYISQICQGIRGGSLKAVLDIVKALDGNIFIVFGEEVFPIDSVDDARECVKNKSWLSARKLSKLTGIAPNSIGSFYGGKADSGLNIVVDLVEGLNGRIVLKWCS